MGWLGATQNFLAVLRMSACLHRAALTNTTSVNRFVASAVEGGAQMGSEEPALWRRVAAAIQLTPAQRADIVQLWRAFRWRPPPRCRVFSWTQPGRTCAGLWF